MSQILVFDTETTGKWHKDLALNHDAQPSLVQIAAIVCDPEGKELSSFACIIRPEGWTVPHEAAAIHGITDHRARAEGVPLVSALALFSAFCSNADKVVGHNLAFDFNIIKRSYFQIDRPDRLPRHRVCTMLMSKDTLQLPSKWPKPGDLYKFPTLNELSMFCFNRQVEKAHTAMADATATKDCYFHLLKMGLPEIPPRIRILEPVGVTGNQDATDTTTRTFAYAQAVIERAPDDNLGEWDKRFIEDNRKRLAEYGERIMFTPGQWAQIERIAKQYKIDTTPGPIPADESSAEDSKKKVKSKKKAKVNKRAKSPAVKNFRGPARNRKNNAPARSRRAGTKRRRSA